MNLSRFTKKKVKRAEEHAPQLSALQMRALEVPGVPSGGLGYHIYDQMQLDSMIQTCLNLKKLGVLAAPWSIQHDGSAEGKRRSEFVQQQFDLMDGSPHSILYQAMDAFAKGWSVQEILWRPVGVQIHLQAVKSKDPSMFGLSLDAYGNLNQLTVQVPGMDRRAVHPAKFVMFAHRASYNMPKGKSDLDPVYLHWKNKQQMMAAWKLHLERYASPTILGKFKRGVTASEQADVLGALRNLHQNTAIVFPEEIQIEPLAGSKESNAAFGDAIDFHNREISRSILGQTLTTDEGRRVGSLALGKVHLQVLLLQLQSLRTQLADLVMTEQIIKPLVQMNFGAGPIPKFVFDDLAVQSFVNGNI